MVNPVGSSSALTAGPAAGRPVIRKSDLDTLSAKLGMSSADLVQALASGGSVSQLAASSGVDPTDLVSALVTGQTAGLDAKLSAGTIDQATHDRLVAQARTSAQALLSWTPAMAPSSGDSTTISALLGSSAPGEDPLLAALSGTGSSEGADPLLSLLGGAYGADGQTTTFQLPGALNLQA